MNLLHSPSFPCFRDAIAILVNDGNLPERKKPAGEGDVRPDFGELVSDWEEVVREDTESESGGRGCEPLAGVVDAELSSGGFAEADVVDSRSRNSTHIWEKD